MWLLKLFSCLMGVLLASCALTGAETKADPIREIRETKVEIVDTACKWVNPIMVSKQDVLTDGTAREILVHNETWKRNCEKEKTGK